MPGDPSSAAPDSGDPGPRQRGRPGYNQDTVLRVAIDLFNRQGYDATSMGDLARELGLTKSAIYHHVPSKQHLLTQALDQALDELAAVIAGVSQDPTGLDARARLRLVLERSVAVLVAHQPAVTLLLRVRGNSAPEVAALERRRALDGLLAQLVRAAAETGAIRADLSPELTSRLLFGMVNSLTEWYDPSGDLDPATLSTTIVSLAFDGLAGPG